MTHVLTLVASDTHSPVTKNHFKKIADIVEAYNLHYSSKIIWLEKKHAGEVGLSDHAPSALVSHLRDALADDAIDFFITKNDHRQKKLLIADMDSTIVTSETLDDLAEHADIKDQVAEITSRAMEGKIDFHDALRERVGLLKGLKTSFLEATLEKTELNEGAKTLVQTMQKQGTTCVLVSGGFTNFTEDIAKRCGFDFNHGNILEIDNDALTGKVIEPILDKFAKVAFLEQYTNDLGLNIEDCLSVGDGANDIPMLKKAGTRRWISSQRSR